MRKMHFVQLEMFKCFINVCDRLNLTYFMVHGSLLGTVNRQCFFPFDDDIDVAMLRKDYEIFLREGKKYLPEYYFIQSCDTEKNYPLPFAKLRDSRTSFIQPSMEKLGVNMGMYIDIFPIDNYPRNRVVRYIKSIHYLVLSSRISCEMIDSHILPKWKRLIQFVSRIIVPSYHNAVQRRSALYQKTKNTGVSILLGGKKNDIGIATEWFDATLKYRFEEIEGVKIPVGYKQYLNRIYGDYENFDPAEMYENEDGTVEVSAHYVSDTISYGDYLKTNKE